MELLRLRPFKVVGQTVLFLTCYFMIPCTNDFLSESIEVEARDYIGLIIIGVGSTCAFCTAFLVLGTIAIDLRRWFQSAKIEKSSDIFARTKLLQEHLGA